MISLNYNSIYSLPKNNAAPFQDLAPSNAVLKICLLALLIFPVLRSLATSDRNANFHLAALDFRQRPPEVQKAISYNFEKLSSRENGEWGINGDSKDPYWTMNINEYELFLNMMKEAPSSRTHFYALDLGAGQFGWGKGLFRFLQDQKDLTLNKTVHIIGIRGEQYTGQEVSTDQNTTKLYQLGGVKLEELSLEFPKRGLFLENKVDLIVSRWCFRHLVDPLGTFIQAYNLLRPESGIALMTGFWILFEKDFSLFSSDSNLNLIHFLLATKAPFLTRSYTDVGLVDFVLKRPDFKPCFLEMSYAGMYETYSLWQQAVVRVGLTTQKEESPRINFSSRNEDFQGDKNLYTWLSKQNIFWKSSLSGPYEWKSIVEEKQNCDSI